jgi:hypothetical protein
MPRAGRPLSPQRWVGSGVGAGPFVWARLAFDAALVLSQGFGYEVVQIISASPEGSVRESTQEKVTMGSFDSRKSRKMRQKVAQRKKKEREARKAEQTKIERKG